MRIFDNLFISNEWGLNYWDSLDTKVWTNIGYPWRPSTEELEEVGKVMDKLKRSSRVALLGSTPEIRSLAASKGIKLDVIDFSKKMCQEMEKICRTGGNEVFVMSDWIKYFSKKKEVYDLVIGDLIERLLPTSRLVSLSGCLSRSLRKNGKIILRSDYYDLKMFNKKLNVKTEIDRLLKTKISTKEMASWLFFGLSGDFIDELEKVRLADMKEFLIKKKVNNEFNDREIQIVDLCIERLYFPSLFFYCRSIDKIESIWGQHFIADVIMEKQLFDGRFIAIRQWQKDA